MPAGGFHGGLRLEGRKEAASRPIRRCPLPALLRIALRQHPGAPARPVVRLGERVAAGQRLASGDGAQSADLHAPCSGEVVAIESGATGLIALRPEPAATGAEGSLPLLDAAAATAEQLRQRIAEAGIVGLGGGAFPSADKLLVAQHTVLLNGAECEPLIACDQRLLQERAAAVIAGGELLRRACGAAALRIAIEDSVPDARAALEALRNDHAFTLDVLPTRYPQGGERQLLEAVLGIEVPRGALPRDVGVAVFNVGTAEAVWQAAIKGRPLTQRLVSVSGGGVVEPVVLEAVIGTPLADLVAAAGGYREHAARLILGGPLTGRALEDDRPGLRKGDNSVIVLSSAELPARAPPRPCIRCGACAEVCPSRLQPQLLWQFLGARHERRLLDHGLFDCIECAACDLVCPSHLPLAARFRETKQTQRLQSLQRQQAEAARQRYLQREQRLQREAAARAAAAAEMQRRSLAQDAVRAALLRARGAAGPASGAGANLDQPAK